jgi:hypothetical protein
LLLSGVVLVSIPGCGRVLTISKADYINTAVHQGRPVSERRGDPLEVSIVCVTGKDLKKDANGMLAPDSQITCNGWYGSRPTHGVNIDSDSYGGFRIPRKQIFLLTDDEKCYGIKRGGRLEGAKLDNRKEVTVKLNIPARTSVIWVFPKFIGPDGQVLSAEPAKFRHRGAFSRGLACEIGVDERDSDDYGQYIKVTKGR